MPVLFPVDFLLLIENNIHRLAMLLILMYDSKALVNTTMKIFSILHRAVKNYTRTKVTLLWENYPRDLSVLTL